MLSRMAGFPLLVLGTLGFHLSKAQTPGGPLDTPTFRVTTRLVFLDVTVSDRKGRPVVKGLTKNDFAITERNQPQPIFSLDSPGSRVAIAARENPSGHAPDTVFVLDLLNSRFEDFAYIRGQVRRYLQSQPTPLNSRTELIVLGNRSLELLQSYTRSKEDLLFALDHLQAALPYKLSGSFLTSGSANRLTRCNKSPFKQGPAGAEEPGVGRPWRTGVVHANAAGLPRRQAKPVRA
jgi:VWFA-related protein